ncbi:MAG TPA: hypothetical protein VHG09_01740 [Longimicrobiales bacterium]|nr:hypothetical protein [Longimicrobiales bacterium]
MADTKRPAAPGPPAKVPVRRLSTEQVEAVVRRAVELQTHEADTTADAGVSDEELIRIGGELGIGPAHMRRALAEVTAESTPAAGGGLLGVERTSASRTVPGTADEVRRHIEKYLLDSQYLAVLRRLPDRTIYEKSSGFHVEMARVIDATRSVTSGRKPVRIGAGFDMRTARTVEVAVTPLEDGFSHVTLTMDLGNQRTGYWAGISASGGAGAIAVGASAAAIIAPPAALVALPIIAASVWGARALYGGVVKRARLHLEALLDHLERGESLLGR